MSGTFLTIISRRSWISSCFALIPSLYIQLFIKGKFRSVILALTLLRTDTANPPHQPVLRDWFLTYFARKFPFFGFDLCYDTCSTQAGLISGLFADSTKSSMLCCRRFVALTLETRLEERTTGVFVIAHCASWLALGQMAVCVAFWKKCEDLTALCFD